MQPRSRRLVNGTGRLLEPGHLVCHCLLIETDHGLVLIDSGLGLGDIAAPADLARHPVPTPDPPPTRPRGDRGPAVTRLGHRPENVRHIVLTHLHRDHAGGISDFPWATIHVHAREHDAAMRPPTDKERAGYRPHQWAHHPKWATYAESPGEPWFGSTPYVS